MASRSKAAEQLAWGYIETRAVTRDLLIAERRRSTPVREFAGRIGVHCS